jgi:hypothetical protein
LILREAGSRSTVAARFEGVGADGGRKRMKPACSKGGGVKVDGGRKRTMTTRSEGGRVEVDSLRKITAMVRSETGVEVAAFSEAVVCFGVGIEDGRRWWHDGF